MIVHTYVQYVWKGLVSVYGRTLDDGWMTREGTTGRRRGDGRRTTRREAREDDERTNGRTDERTNGRGARRRARTTVCEEKVRVICLRACVSRACFIRGDAMTTTTTTTSSVPGVRRSGVRPRPSGGRARCRAHRARTVVALARAGGGDG